MPRKSGKVPSYCHHRPSGRAVVYLDRKPTYLGPYGSPGSYEKYEREIAEWRNRRLTGATELSALRPDQLNSFTISELILAYFKFAEKYYVTSDGEQTKEFTEMKFALRPLRKLYGRTLVRDFGPRALKAVRQHMVDSGELSRKVINRRINRIRRAFRWAVSEERAPQGAYEALRSVEGLKFGRTQARETERIKPVPQPYVDAVVEVVSPPIATMIRVQQLAAMRPCEVVEMRACDIDMSGDVWLFEPFHHKNRWRGHDRHIALGPVAQDLIKPFLKLNTQAFLFSPREAELWRNAQRRKNRKTPMTPSQRARKPKKKPKRDKRCCYDVDAYRKAITYGIKKANRQRERIGEPELPHWCPLQRRHSRATEIRKRYGIEAAQVTLGHTKADVTQIYAERDLAVAVQIAREIG